MKIWNKKNITFKIAKIFQYFFLFVIRFLQLNLNYVYISII